MGYWDNVDYAYLKAFSWLQKHLKPGPAENEVIKQFKELEEIGRFPDCIPDEIDEAKLDKIWEFFYNFIYYTKTSLSDECEGWKCFSEISKIVNVRIKQVHSLEQFKSRNKGSVMKPDCKIEVVHTNGRVDYPRIALIGTDVFSRARICKNVYCTFIDLTETGMTFKGDFRECPKNEYLYIALEPIRLNDDEEAEEVRVYNNRIMSIFDGADPYTFGGKYYRPACAIRVCSTSLNVIKSIYEDLEFGSITSEKVAVI